MALSAEKIWSLASFDNSIRSKVAIELIASWPIPAQKSGEDGFWFFYYAIFGLPPAKEFKIYPPSWKVWIRSADGTITDLNRISPQDVGLKVKQGEPFSVHSWPKEWTVEDADRKRVELLKSYDVVIDSWKKHAAVSPADKKVSAFRELFSELSPPPLLPCYLAMGGEFFSWLGIKNKTV